MNLSPNQTLRNSPKRRRAVSAFTAFALIIFLFAAGSAQAESVRVNQVVQTLSSYQGPVDLRVNNTTQDPVSTTNGTTATAGPGNDGPKTAKGPGDAAKLDQIIAGAPVLQDPGKLGVEIIEEAEVEGTICDCGELLAVGGGFAKWPLLFLTAVPLVFINDCDDCDDNPSSTPTPTPPSNPTPTPTPTPEPASLLLFGTGLLAAGAGLRRRYSNSKLLEQVKATEEEQN
jgi:hypothetical protein